MRALITGVTGQDGSYLAELLLSKGYKVFGVVRRASTPSSARLSGVLGHPNFHILPGDLQDSHSLRTCVTEAQPSEVYNLGAQSFVGASWRQPELTLDVCAMGTLRLLEACRTLPPGSWRFYQAGTSEQFGPSEDGTPQNEMTPFAPRSPYGVAKVAAHHICKSYRESYGLHISVGILFNHESPRRGIEFVTQKIASAVARIKREGGTLILGNLDSVRDWGYAPDYVEGMWRMLQQESPDDYVLGTGISHSIKAFCSEAFGLVGLRWQDHVRQSAEFIRPNEVGFLLADPQKAARNLFWRPTTTFRELVKSMVEFQMNTPILQNEHIGSPK